MPILQSTLFWTTTFLGAFLLFLVQPLIANIILPWFGGSAAVWTACMMFFQVTLVAGYAYAHIVRRTLSCKHALGLHAVLLIAACGWLPIIPDPALQPDPGSDLNLAIAKTLLMTVGLPYFLLSANSTLVQMWLQALSQNAANVAKATTTIGGSPYRLYAVSNLGSMSALVLYPFCIQPAATLTGQSWIWSAAFITFAVLSVATAWPTRRIDRWQSVTETVEDSATVGRLRIGIWFALAAVASVVLLATTNLICQEIASAPFLWILPLSAYLGSFVICFQSPRLYHRPTFITLLCVFVVLSIAVVQAHIYLSMLIQIVVLTGVCFFVAMVCHGELERTKPPASNLTAFYLTLSLGGASGGIFTACIAPHIFDGFYEFHFAILACLGIVLYRVYQSSTATGKIFTTAGCGLAAAITLSSYMLQTHSHLQANVVIKTRNAYGIVAVKQNDTYRRFISGNVDHGGQFIAPEKSLLPSGYYTTNSGAGIAFRRLRQYRSESISPGSTHDEKLDVAVIGMGIGAMLAWSQPQDQFTMYELNPAVVDIANDHFTYLGHFANQTRIEIGDGRLLLKRDTVQGRPRKFDLIFVDAFSSDAIPQHLITSQCVDLYLRHLADDGILIFHITNRFVDLRPVIATFAKQKRLSSLIRENKNTPDDRGTLWVLLSRRQSMFDPEWIKHLQSPWPQDMPDIGWTDDFAPLAPVTLWGAAVDFEALRQSQSEIRKPSASREPATKLATPNIRPSKSDAHE